MERYPFKRRIVITIRIIAVFGIDKSWYEDQ